MPHPVVRVAQTTNKQHVDYPRRTKITSTMLQYWQLHSSRPLRISLPPVVEEKVVPLLLDVLKEYISVRVQVLYVLLYRLTRLYRSFVWFGCDLPCRARHSVTRLYIIKRESPNCIVPFRSIPFSFT
jgi:hypothetical protein